MTGMIAVVPWKKMARADLYWPKDQPITAVSMFIYTGLEPQTEIYLFDVRALKNLADQIPEAIAAVELSNARERAENAAKRASTRTADSQRGDDATDSE